MKNELLKLCTAGYITWLTILNNLCYSAPLNYIPCYYSAIAQKGIGLREWTPSLIIFLFKYHFFFFFFIRLKF